VVDQIGGKHWHLRRIAVRITDFQRETAILDVPEFLHPLTEAGQ
jgi:hypothetical protein